MKIYDSFLSESEFNQLAEAMYSIPWHFSGVKVSKETKTMTENSVDEISNFQFTHNFYANMQVTSNYFYILDKFIIFFECFSIIRIKANLTTPHESSIKLFGFHEDCKQLSDKNISYKTAIFYVNTNNGKTVFRNGKEIESVANRLIIFDGNLEHTGTTHSDTKTRCVINFNYIG